MIAIFKRELKSYVNSMTGYVFVAFLILVMGIYAMVYNFMGLSPNFEYVLSDTSFIFLIIIPVLTMKVVAEEKKQKTDQLLYSLPLSMTQVVMGKFLAMATIFAIPVLFMCLIPLILTGYGTVNLAASYGALFGYFLLGLSLISVGLFMSSLTENQIVAAVLSFVAILLCYIMTGLSSYLPATADASWIFFAIVLTLLCVLLYFLSKNPTLAVSVWILLEIGLFALYQISPTLFEGAAQSVLQQCSMFDRLDNFINGIFDVTSIVYYITVTGLFLFFTVQSMEKRRWN